MSRRLTLYGRLECSLCEAMHRELLAVAPRLGFEVVWVDVDGDPWSLQRYGHLVPVLCDDKGEAICHYFLDLDALENYFATP
ncbi:MAG: glutaredoxin family protein [Pseudomonadota bacterium]